MGPIRSGSTRCIHSIAIRGQIQLVISFGDVDDLSSRCRAAVLTNREKEGEKKIQTPEKKKKKHRVRSSGGETRRVSALRPDEGERCCTPTLPSRSNVAAVTPPSRSPHLLPPLAIVTGRRERASVTLPILRRGSGARS